MNSWMSDIKKDSHLMFISNWISKVGRLRYQRSQEIADRDTLYPVKIENKINAIINQSSRLQVLQFGEKSYEVMILSTGNKKVVDL